MPFQCTINYLIESYRLSWLYLQMSHSIFLNLNNIFNRELTITLQRGIIPIDFVDWVCICTKNSLINDKCAFSGTRQKIFLIYEVTCKNGDKIYIGNIQQTLKKYMNGHSSNITVLPKNGKYIEFLCKTLHDLHSAPDIARQYDIYSHRAGQPHPNNESLW